MFYQNQIFFLFSSLRLIDNLMFITIAEAYWKIGFKQCIVIFMGILDQAYLILSDPITK